MSIPESHVARNVPQFHDNVQLGLLSDSGKCDHQKAGGSRQEVRERTGYLGKIK